MSTYSASGVDYDVLDAGKRAAVAAARSSSGFPASRGIESLDASRGEPAFVFRADDRYMAQVLECLGTKSTIARTVQETSGVNRFDAIGYDAVAAIVNDMICVGALPVVVNAYFATGSPQWYGIEGRFEALVRGWLDACRDSAATWGGGESPGLNGIVAATEIDLAGSATGLVPEGLEPILGQRLSAGDEIVFVESSGLHTNGSSLARRMNDELPDGYATRLGSGRSFGEAVLDASFIYVDLIEKLFNDKVDITYLSHVTGHGMRKLMRADAEFTYRITTLPPVPEVLQFMVSHFDMDATEAYGTFNMGAGFAVYCKSGHGSRTVEIAQQSGFAAWVAGVVEGGPKQVLLEPVGVTYGDDELQLR